MPNTGDTAKLLAHPLAFCNEHSIAPDDDPKLMMDGAFVQPQAKNRMSGLDETDQQLTILRNEYKIAAARLRPFPRYGAGTFELEVYAAETLTGAQKDKCFPIWFLPWKSGRIVSMQIPAADQVPPKFASPSIFFTAAINGCSVFVRGPSKSPTVYHAGITGPLPGGDAVHHWRELFLRDAPKHATFSEVNKLQYADVKISDYNPKVDPKANRRVGTPDSQAYAEFLRAAHQKEFRIEELVPWGMVFGLRDPQGDWTFYLQENAKVIFYTIRKQKTYKFLGPLSPVRDVDGEKFVRSRPMVVRQIFPGGGGAVQMLRPVRLI